ncbi:hypothetical protein [Flavobacterium reichenbachii]|uniref:hypothetical protein n=1 Tax=Flavobacterium reichenbachii TaxID=362418 RepID=UPI000B5BB826|nr:hypothetical protein [Flavobacterium reichenbachii]OXB15975.1 hypothetical protein B0A68_06800 [Flavobacterium reichenbachii]
MKNITEETLQETLKEAASALIAMAGNSCWNNISQNTTYIISEIVSDGQNFFDKRITRKKATERKTPKSLEEIVIELRTLYKDFYDLNFYIYKSSKDNTIIEIQYYSKLSLNPDFYETVKDNEPLLHYKIGIPPYARDKKKYDVNWELGGIRYNWNTFLYRLKFKYKFRKRLKKYS